MTGAECVVQLLECCDETLRKDLTRSAGGSLTSKSEAEVLSAIRTLAVREENTMVARVAHHNMRQDRDEPVRNFGARLRGQAGVCKFIIPVPIHWRDAVKAGIDQDIKLGVLEAVPIGQPVTWCHRMVVCANKNGSLRRTVDFQPLNSHATRETHHTQSPFHQARSVPQGKKKTVFDAWNGYHSVPLHRDDRHLTTFITPWGRYRCCTAPQGYIAS